MGSRSIYAVMLGAFMMSTCLAGPASANDAKQTIQWQIATQELTEALKVAASHGQSSFLASVYENARLTPFRADAIRAQALAMAPGLGREITLATGIALDHARMVRSTGAASTANGSAAAALPPGADNNVDLATIPEFQRNWGLGAIGTQAALDRNLTGKGVVVGVVDTGIDRALNGTTHPEFAGRIDPRSTSLYHWFDVNLAVLNGDVAAGFNRPANASEDGHGHGTHVSGIIAAAKDGQGMQGVAPGATILSIQALSSIAPSPFADRSGYFMIDDEIYHAGSLSYCGINLYLTQGDQCTPASQLGTGTEAAIAYLATQKDVRVINGSFGPNVAPGTVTWNTGNLLPEASAVRASLKAGQILTIAAGNDGLRSPAYGENPSGIGLFPFLSPSNANAKNSAGAPIYVSPTNYDFSDMTEASLAAAEAADGIKRGRIIVVVATDSQKVLAAYSNACGVAAQWCLATPGGTNDNSAERPIYSAAPYGEYQAMQGTSMAAPHVAGAVAVMIEAFPTYTPAQITNILFETAEDLGAPGIDPIYGRGFLRLDRALNSGPAGLNPADGGKFVAGAGTAKGDKVVWTNPIDSQGSFGKQGQGTLVLPGNATFRGGVAVEEGELRVDGNLTAPVNVSAGGTLSGNGTVAGSVTSSGNLSPGASPGLLTINGNLTLTALSQTNIEVDGPLAQVGAGGYDRILLTGTSRTATVAGVLAPTLRGIAGDANNNFTPSLGQAFTFLDVANGQVAGSFTSLLQPASGLAVNTRFDVVYGMSSLALATTPLAYANLGSFGVSQSEAARAVGGAIDAIRPVAGTRPNAELNALFSNLYISDATGLAAALEQATGRIYVDAGQSAVLSVGRFADQIWQHQTDMLLSGKHAGDNARLWTQGGRWSGDHRGFESTSGSATFGIDVPLNAGWVGGAFRYEGSDIKSGINGSGNLDTYQAAIYGLSEMVGLDISGRAGLAYGKLDVSRSINFAAISTASLSSDTHGFGGFAEATVQKNLQFGDSSLIPSMTLGYRAFRFDGLRETGGVLPLSMSSKTFEEGHLTTAVTFSHSFKLDDEFRLTPSATAGYRRDLLGITDHSSASVLGTGFTTRGEAIGRDAFVGGIKIEASQGERLSFAAGYDVDIRRGSNQHRFSASLMMRW